MEATSARKELDRFYQDGVVVLPVDVIGIANSNGIDVRRARFAGPLRKSVYGFIEKANESTRIVVNADDAVTRRRFTVAHELGHYFLHHQDEAELKYLDMRSTVRTEEETEANKFAAELLMPEKELREEHEKLMFPTVEALARKFGVSKQAMQYRLKKLELTAI